MQQLANTLTVIREKLQPGEPAAAIRSTGPGSELDCRLCDNTGWRRIDGERLKRCECVKENAMVARLAQIPERFKSSTFQSYRPGNPKQEQALVLMQKKPAGSFYLTGSYGSGKTHLLYAQYREMVQAGKTCCHVRTTRELVKELQRAEYEDGFVPPVLTAASKPGPYHLYWDDIDKLKVTDFKTKVLFDLVDGLYRQKHGLTVTSNFSMQDLVERERLHPAIVRRLDDTCRMMEL